MKANWHVYFLAGGLLLIASAAAQYAIDWSTIDGGGGTSSGGVYAVRGTIGQPDAGGPMTGDDYSLVGGFWAVYAVQTAGAPMLSIVVSAPDEVTVFWEPDEPGWVLQETVALEPAAWTNSSSLNTNPAVIPVTRPTTFYRLNR